VQLWQNLGKVLAKFWRNSGEIVKISPKKFKAVRFAIFFTLTLVLAWLFFGLSINGQYASGTSAPQPNPIAIPLAVHPLPASLADWQDATQSGDYFAELQELQALPVGALVWSEFPVTVSIDPSAPAAWKESVQAAVTAWSAYLPLVIWEDDRALTAADWDDRTAPPNKPPDPSPELPDITIVRTTIASRRQSGNLRAASARTTYEFWLETLETGDDHPTAIATGRSRLAHRFLIQVSPTQTGDFVESAVRHELGHALGIWGHSSDPGDVMYRSQIATPPHLSTRDVNTLRRIYEQPTRLGWWF